MQFEPKSISEQIECLARLTAAPGSFVVQVKSLFSRKGISLDEDATPYLKALEEAFKREENIRSTTQRARQNIRKLQKNFNRIGQAYGDVRDHRGERGLLVERRDDDHRPHGLPRPSCASPVWPGPPSRPLTS